MFKHLAQVNESVDGKSKILPVQKTQSEVSISTHFNKQNVTIAIKLY